MFPYLSFEFDCITDTLEQFRILAFFNYDQLCPDMHNVFAVAERAEVKHSTYLGLTCYFAC